MNKVKGKIKLSSSNEVNNLIAVFKVNLSSKFLFWFSVYFLISIILFSE